MPSAILLNHDDPIFDFEHMMGHRDYFAIMGSQSQGLSGFSKLPYVLDPARNTDQPAWGWNKSHQQAHDDYNGNLPDNSNDGFTTTVVTPADVHGSGTAPAGSPTITLTGLTHSIIIGSTIVEIASIIIGQVSGPPGGNGVYSVSPPVLVTLTLAPLTITHPSYIQAAPITDAGGFGIHQSGILLEGDGQSQGNREWWTFENHTQHLIANNIVFPLPTTAPTTAGTGPGTVTDVSNPWWWQAVEVVFPFW